MCNQKYPPTSNVLKYFVALIVFMATAMLTNLSIMAPAVARAGGAGMDETVLRQQLSRTGWVRVRVELAQRERNLETQTGQPADQDDAALDGTLRAILASLPAGSFEAVQREAGSAMMTLSVNAAGLSRLQRSPRAAAVYSTANPEMWRMTAGSFHSLAIQYDGSLWAWGFNQYGQLGDSAIQSWTLIPAKIMNGVMAVSAGSEHTLCLKSDGSLWAWGRNDYGQVGDGTIEDRRSPVRIMTGVMAIAAGEKHSLAIKTDGTLWTWGRNDDGQLGDGTTTHRLAPVNILSDVTAIAAGAWHSMAIQSDGSLWAWGLNDVGQLGDGTNTTRTSPVQVLTNVTSMTAGVFHTLAVKSDDSLWAWGSNYYGQLGDGTTGNRWKPVQVLTGVSAVSAAGFGHTLAIKLDGSLWAWGNNQYGQLGDGTTWTSKLPIQVLSGVSGVSAGGYYGAGYSLGRKKDGSLWAWGNNQYGQLGDGSNTSRTTPVQVKGFGPTIDKADFVVSNVVLKPGGPTINTTFSATVTVKKQGTAAGIPGTLQVWSNQPETQACGAIGDKAATLTTSLGAGSSQKVTVTGLPAGATPGIRKLRVFVEGRCETDELNDTNNQSVLPYTVFAQPTPDFVVTKIVLTPSVPKQGNTFSATVTVKNQGSGGGNGGYLDVWTHQRTAAACYATGNAYANVGYLAAGGSKTLTFNNLRSGQAGAKTFRAFVDSFCGVDEWSNANNQRVQGYTVAH